MIILEKLGIRQFPKEPDDSDIELWLNDVKANLGDRHPTSLVELPAMSEPNMLAAMRLMFYVVPTAYKYKPALMVLIGFAEVNLSLQYGNSPVSTYAYSLQGLVLCNTFGEIEKGYQFGQLALQLDQQSNPIAYGRAFYVVYSMINYYKEPLENSLKALKKAYTICLEAGDLEFAGYALAFYSFYSYLSGTELSGLAQEMSANSKALERIKRETPKNWIDIYHQIVDNLLARSQNPCAIVGAAYDEEKMLPLHKQANDLTTQGYFYIPRVFLCYLFQDWQGASESLENAENCLGGAAGTPLVTLFYLYQSLVLLAEFALQSESECQERLEKIIANQKILKNAAIHAPTNYLHKLHLVEAEIYRVLGDKMEAIEMYDRAIVGAKENEYIQEEALANELAAKFYLNWGKEKIACTYMQEAYSCYAQWGAKAKTDDLEKRYPQLLSPILQRQQLRGTAKSKITTLTKRTVSSTSSSSGELLNLASLMKASRSLSQEIDLDRSIANFIKIIAENAGAEALALMLFQEDTLMLTAYGAGEQMSVMSIPVEKTNSVPLTLINQVKNTRQHLVLDDAKQANEYARDAYIQKHQPQSILCMPLIDRGQLIGILYLENNQTSGAFSSDRIEILNLLCSQAAIALQNAQLYDKEQLARNDLQQALTDLQQAQLQLVQSEKMATLGNLVAGVAHEINNPVGFIGGNVDAAQEHLQDLLSILALYEENTSPPKEIAEEIEDLEPDFIAEDFPKLIASMEEGCNIIRNISTSLRTFSRTDTASKTEFNLHDGIDSTLLILKYRLKANEQRPAIEIVKKYADIPVVKCYPGQLNQVFMNLLANAIDALDESNQGKTFAEIEKQPNQITIETELSGDNKQIIVRIADNGTGMPEEVKAKLFEQGFTTKGVGKGTGLGMAIAHQIVTEKHGGQISCNSKVGEGTIFTIVIPR
ncbi:ATP-binding protein [Okeania sp. SIO2B3]|uniref:GAF domain-containing sensor histidine kinase n=1 Tax=Okeania sp. SIO2B3 TaxID=2607784 RepID=UPI0034131E0F